MMTGMRVARIAPWVAVAAVACAFAWSIWLDSMASDYGVTGWEIAAWSVATFASTGVGLVLATRRASNPIGWLLLGNGLVLAAMGLADSFADYAVLAHPGALPGGAWAVLFSERAWPLLFVFVTAIAWVFPDGRLPSPRWRPYRHRGGGVLRGAAGPVAAGGRALQRGVRRRLEPAPGGAGVDPRHPVPRLRPGGPGEPGRGRAGRADPAAALDGSRAPAGEVARVRGRAHPRSRRRLPARGRGHGRRRPGDGDRRGCGAHGHPGGGRHRGDALPPLRDRPADQPHAGLRGPQRRPRGDLRRGRAGPGRGDRLGLDARRPRPRPSRSRSCSGRCASASSSSSTGASTAPATRGCAPSSASSADLREGARRPRPPRRCWPRRSAIPG